MNVKHFVITEPAADPRCPICGNRWDHWIVCEYPGCHDGRLPKPRAPVNQKETLTPLRDEEG